MNRRARFIWSASFATLLSCQGVISGPDDTASSGSPPGNGAPSSSASTTSAPAGLRRLTATQYLASVRALFGASLNLPTEFDPDDSAAVFASVGGYRVVTSPAGVLKYEDAAFAIAAGVFADPELRGQVLACDPATGEACATSFVTVLGRKIWRRPLTEAEVARYVALIAGVTELLGTPESGFEYALAGLLQSPNFMYVPEVGEVVDGRLRFTSHETASRLSYLLTDGPPDTALSAAADANGLVRPEGLRAELERLLALPEAEPALVGFFGQLLDLDQLASLTKDADVYPQASPSLFEAMRVEAEHLIKETALVQRGRLLDLFDHPLAYVNADLAALYGLAAPDGSTTQPVPLPPGDRGGILTSAAWLSINAKPYASSPTLRGVWIRERLLCEVVAPPPPEVNNALPPPGERTSGPATTREILEEHRRSPQCAGCHESFDPLGVAFENFDGLGAYRSTEEGLTIDPSGSLDGQPFATAAELVALLKSDPRVSDCLVRHLYRFVSGHQGLASEEQVVSALAPAFRSEPDFLSLLAEMVESDWFRAPGAPL